MYSQTRRLIAGGDRPINDVSRHIRGAVNYSHSSYHILVLYWEDMSFVLRIPQLKDKMTTRIRTGYGSITTKLFFDGDESKYKLWEVKFLGYLRIPHLFQILLSQTDQSDDKDFVEKNATVFVELIQYLDDQS